MRLATQLTRIAAAQCQHLRCMASSALIDCLGLIDLGRINLRSYSAFVSQVGVSDSLAYALVIVPSLAV